MRICIVNIAALVVISSVVVSPAPASTDIQAKVA